MNYGWAGSVEEFKTLSSQDIIAQLQNHVYKTSSNDPKIDSQKRAWIDSLS